jgi:hypothetical protein
MDAAVERNGREEILSGSASFALPQPKLEDSPSSEGWTSAFDCRVLFWCSSRLGARANLTSNALRMMSQSIATDCNERSSGVLVAGHEPSHEPSRAHDFSGTDGNAQNRR